MLHIKNIKPLFTSLIVTAEKFERDVLSKSVIAKKGDLKTWQKVVAVGSLVRDIKVGDTVMINIDNYAVKKYSKDSIQNDLDNNPKIRYQFNWVMLDDANGNPVEHLLITDRDCLFAFDGEEKYTDEDIIIPNKKLIL